MKTLLNIASEDKKHLYIDPATVTGMYVNPEKKELSLSNEKGRMLWINYEGYGVDPDVLLEKLATAGNKLVAFPVRYDGGKESLHYIAPSAVTYATVTEVTKEGNVGAIIGIKGEGRLESYGTKPEELQTLLDAVKATGKTLLEYKPDEAHSRWYNAAALYIDPAAVTSIREDGYQINVYFEASGSLDVQTSRDSAKKSDRESELLDQLWEDGKGTKFKTPNEAWAVARKMLEAEESQQRRDFANGIAAANGTLTEISPGTRAIHIRPEDFAYITFHDDDKKDVTPGYQYMLILQPQKTPDNPYAEGVRAYFNTAADRTAAFEALTDSAPKAPAAKKPAALKP